MNDFKIQKYYYSGLFLPILKKMHSSKIISTHLLKINDFQKIVIKTNK